jgi:hypothetical protein
MTPISFDPNEQSPPGYAELTIPQRHSGGESPDLVAKVLPTIAAHETDRANVDGAHECLIAHVAGDHGAVRWANDRNRRRADPLRRPVEPPSWSASGGAAHAIGCQSGGQAASTGSASPAGDALPRLPPTVPRLRICGDPTVREACHNATAPGTSRMMRPYVTPAPRT